MSSEAARTAQASGSRAEPSRRRPSPVRWARFGALSEAIARAWPLAQPPVLVLSLPRSGSSWVGQGLGHAEEALYLREPLTQSHLARGGSLSVFEVDPDAPPREYRRDADRAFCGCPAFRPGIVRRRDDWSLARRRRRRVIIKEVNPLATDWLIRRYRPKVIFLVRHPGAVALSYWKLGWTRLRTEERFAALARGRAARHGPKSAFWAQHGLFQALALERALAALAHHQDHEIVRYEDLCAEPIAGFRRLYAFAGLGWGAGVEDFVAGKTVRDDSHPYGTSRRSRAMIDAWKGEIAEPDRRALRDAYLERNPPLYTAPAWA